MPAEVLAKAAATAAAGKKAFEVVILDLRGISTFTDYYVICTVESEPQIRAVTKAVEEDLLEHLREKPFATDGASTSNWVVLDYVDVLVHIFTPEMRERYAVEDLWGDAPRIHPAT